MKGRKFLAMLCAFMMLVMNFSSCVNVLAEEPVPAATDNAAQEPAAGAAVEKSEEGAEQAATPWVRTLTASFPELDILTVGPMTEEQQTTEVLVSMPKKQNLLPLVLLVAVLAVCGGLLARKLPARVTNEGAVITGEKPTRAQTEAAVRAGEETPSDRVEEQLRKKL